MKRLFRVSMLFVFTLGLACSGSGGHGSSSSLSIQLEPLAQVSPSDIVAIRLTVFDSSGAQVAIDTRPFIPGASTIFDLVIEPGTGYRFVAEALDASGEAIYRGSDTADVGTDGVVNLTIELVSLDPDPGPGPGPDPNCADADGDGFGAPGSPFCTGGPLLDCDDGNSAVNPAAIETCNGIDDNCNGPADELIVCALDCMDQDGDGYGRPGSPECPAGPLPDCNDSDANVFPRAPELCNEIDDDCDGRIDEGFDLDNDTFTTCRGDCDDFANTIFPGAPEVCNELDDDCDGAVDEDDVCLEPCDDGDGDGFGTNGSPECAAGSDIDCDDSDPAINPDATEVCDGVDNNCVAGIDEGFDADTDTFTTCDGDCDDTDAAIFPGAPEICDGLDQDCDGVIDSEGAIGPDLFVDASNTSGFEVGSAVCAFDTIQEGIDAIANGNTLNVASGSYGAFTISGRSNLTVSGGNPRPVVTGVNQNAVVVDGASSGITISNLETNITTGGNFFGATTRIVGSGVTLTSMDLEAFFTGVQVGAGANVTIQSSTLTRVGQPRAPGTQGITESGVDVVGSTATVTDTTIQSFVTGFDCSSGSTCTADGSSAISSSEDVGVSCSASTCDVVGSTSINGTGFDGLVCIAGGTCTLGSNASSTNSGDIGVACDGANSCTVNGTVTGSGGPGVYCATACTVSGAVVTGNTVAAVLTEGNFSIQNSTLGDTIAGRGLAQDGVFADLGALGITGTIQNNTLRNSNNGIDCFEGGRGLPNVTCSGNTFSGNSTDVGGGCISFVCTP